MKKDNPVLEAPSRYWIEVIRKWKDQGMNGQPFAEKVRVAKAYIDMAPNKAEMKDALLLDGLVHYLKRHKVYLHVNNEKQAARAKQNHDAANEAGWQRRRKHTAAERAKAEAFERIVETLDHMKVGTKILGDCTKADLLREAVALEHDAKGMNIHAAFLRKLASLLGPHLTVREATDRGKVVALLTTTFPKEDA